MAPINSPERVHGSDGREHIVCDLVITNTFTAEATLTSLVVRAGGKKLLDLRGHELAAAIHPFGGGGPTRHVAVSSTVVAYVDIALPRSSGRVVPKGIRSRLSYELPSGAPASALIGSKTVKSHLHVDRQAPIVIAPPLRGPGWVSVNGCCEDAALPHRSTILSANGTYVAIETFSGDYVRRTFLRWRRYAERRLARVRGPGPRGGRREGRAGGRQHARGTPVHEPR